MTKTNNQNTKNQNTNNQNTNNQNTKNQNTKNQNSNQFNQFRNPLELAEYLKNKRRKKASNVAQFYRTMKDTNDYSTNLYVEICEFERGLFPLDKTRKSIMNFREYLEMLNLTQHEQENIINQLPVLSKKIRLKDNLGYGGKG